MKLGLLLLDLTSDQVAQIAAQYGSAVVVNAAPPQQPTQMPAQPTAPAMPGMPGPGPAGQGPGQMPGTVAPPTSPPPQPPAQQLPQGKSAQVLSAMNGYAQTHGVEGARKVLNRLGLQKIQDAQDTHLDWLLYVFSNVQITPDQAATMQ